MLRSRVLIAFFLVATSLPVFSQAFSNAQIDKLLQSDDPRLIAFGAWELGGVQYDDGMLVLLNLAERWDLTREDRIDGDWVDAMTVVMDTLIQRKERPTPAAVEAIADTFPAQALILVSRLPVEEAEPILLSWFEAGEGVDRGRPGQQQQNRLLLARVAAMMLAKKRPADVAATLLGDSVERLAVSVPDAGGTGVERCLVNCTAGPVCREGFIQHQRPGWPQRFQYVVEENRPSSDATGPLVVGALLVQAGGDRITYRRVEAEVDTQACYSPAFLNSITRHHLLAEMLGVPDDAMAWAAQMDMILPWVNEELYLRDLSKQVSAEEDKLRATAKQLYLKQALTESQMRATRPRLSVFVFDDRSAIDSPNSVIPQIQIADDRTTYRIFQGSR